MGQAVVGVLTVPGSARMSVPADALCAGPGAESFLANAASSDEEFDTWFMGSVAEVHGMDTSGPMPPTATHRL
jgi:hypothetical protein